jgi:hypothetical protein
MHELEGSYALAILFHQDDEKVYFAKMHSPMIIGRGEKRYYLASDYLPMLPYAKDFYIVLDHQYGYIASDEAVIKNLNPSEYPATGVHWTPEHYEPWKSKEKFELIHSIEPKYNRMILFDGFKYDHGMNICNDDYSSETYRMNQALFFRDANYVDN